LRTHTPPFAAWRALVFGALVFGALAARRGLLFVGADLVLPPLAVCAVFGSLAIKNFQLHWIFNRSVAAAGLRECLSTLCVLVRTGCCVFLQRGSHPRLFPFCSLLSAAHGVCSLPCLCSKLIQERKLSRGQLLAVVGGMISVRSHFEMLCCFPRVLFSICFRNASLVLARCPGDHWDCAPCLFQQLRWRAQFRPSNALLTLANLRECVCACRWTAF
jgi:hypothetical protein